MNSGLNVEHNCNCDNNNLSYYRKSVVYLPNCNAEIRCANWLGAINNITTIGCGINVLAFLDEIDSENAKRGSDLAKQQGGTPFQFIVEWFNSKNNFNTNSPNQFGEWERPIETLEDLTIFFNGVKRDLPINTCVLVKFNRNTNPSLRPQGLSAGHYVLLSKHPDGTLWTYEPLTSKIGQCDKREYTGMKPSLFNAYQRNGYITASFLVLETRINKSIQEITHLIENETLPPITQPPPVPTISPPPLPTIPPPSIPILGGRNNNIDVENKINDGTLFNEFIEDINKFTVCNKTKTMGGEKKNKKKMTNTKKTKKIKYNRKSKTVRYK